MGAQWRTDVVDGHGEGVLGRALGAAGPDGAVDGREADEGHGRNGARGTRAFILQSGEYMIIAFPEPGVLSGAQASPLHGSRITSSPRRVSLSKALAACTRPTRTVLNTTGTPKYIRHPETSRRGRPVPDPRRQSLSPAYTHPQSPPQVPHKCSS